MHIRLLPITLCFIASWTASILAQSPSAEVDADRLRQSLADALSTGLSRPDLVLILIESEDAGARAAAAETLASWHMQIPSAMGLLRRLAQDPEANVRLAAILAGLQIQSKESVAAVASAIDDSWDNDEAARIVDAVDSRWHRQWWKARDELQLRTTIERLAAIAHRRHSIDELLRLPIPEPTSDVIDSGRESFVQARCDVCHRVAGYGRAVGPDLKNIGSCFDNQQLIQHIIDPSLDIHDVGRGEQILLSDGRLLAGQIVHEAQDHLMVRLDAMKVDSAVRIDREQIIERRRSPVSPMPTGLLDALTPTQIADLVSFLRSNGGQISDLPHPHHH